MKLKAYVKPTIEIVSVELNDILAASITPGPGVETGNGLGNEYEESDVTYTNKHTWEDESMWY